MLYNPHKFNYSQLSRESTEHGRKYVAPDGTKLPSVTTILDATKTEESRKALAEWRKRMGPKRAQEITTEAAGRGTRMHKFLENYVKTGDTGQPGSNPYSKQSHSMAGVIVSQGLSKCSEFWGTEISLYYPEIYAGTTDLVGVYEGQPAIMDFKQTNKPKKREWIDDYFLQLAAYALAHNAVWGTTIDCGVVFMCSAAGEYQEFVISGPEFQVYCDGWFNRLDQYYSKFV